MLWPKYIKAQPTLRGLRARLDQSDSDVPDHAIYPWDRVGRVTLQNNAANWVAYDEDGHEISIGGRKLYLSMAGVEANRTARCAQQRYLRRAWRENRLNISEVYGRPSLRKGLFAMALCAFLSGVGVWNIFPGFMRAFDEARSAALPASYPVLIVVCAIIYLLLIVFFCVPPIFLISRRLRINVVSANFSSDRIQVVLRDGTNRELPWRLLANACDKTGRLEFQDQTVLHLPVGMRTSVLLRILAERMNPNLAEQDRRSRRNTVIRIVGYGLVGIALAGLLGRHLQQNYHNPRSLIEGAGAAGVMALICALAILGERQPPRHRRQPKT